MESNGRLLVVDDDPGVRAMLVESKDSVETLGVGSGGEEQKSS